MTHPVDSKVQRLKDRKAAIGFAVSDPLSISAEGAPFPFFSSGWARDQYRINRSEHAPAGTITRHLIASSEVIGFVCYRQSTEDVAEWINLFAAIEVVYVQPEWRGIGLSRVLLKPLLSEIDTALGSPSLAGRAVRVLPAGSVVTKSWERVLHSLRRGLVPIVARHPLATIPTFEISDAPLAPSEASAVLADFFASSVKGERASPVVLRHAQGANHSQPVD